MEKEKTTIIILHHAGGASHQYLSFANQLKRKFDVYLYDMPGHGQRSKESLLGSMEEAVCDLMQKISFIGNGNWVVFGHSLGSQLAHALVRMRFKDGLSLPSILFASGAPSPVNRVLENRSDLSSDDLWSWLSDSGGIRKDILHNSEFRSFFEPILRSDMRIVEKYHPVNLKLPVPVHVFYGTADVTEENARSWSQDSDYPPILYPFPGDHFYLFNYCNDLCEIMEKEIVKQIPVI